MTEDMMKVDEPNPVQMQIKKLEFHNIEFELNQVTAEVKVIERKMAIKKQWWEVATIEADVERRYQQARQQVSSIRVVSAHMKPIVKLPSKEGSPKRGLFMPEKEALWDRWSQICYSCRRRGI